MPDQTIDIQILDDNQSLAQAAAEDWLAQAAEAIEQRGRFLVSLSGGSTPRLLFQILASSPYRDAIDWRKVVVFFGDERCVPADHPDSNFRMASEAFLDSLSLPPENVHRVRTELGHEAAADDYAQQLGQTIADIVSDEQRGFDLVMLGLGPDGHIASLFPDTPILDIEDRLASDVYVEKFDSWRISITYPVIDNARAVMLLAAGTAKQEIIDEVFNRPPEQAPQYPVERLQPAGEMTWYLDQAAAARLVSG